MSTAPQLRGRNCVVTGATGGLGAAIAARYWRAGANLLLVGRSEERLFELRDTLPHEGRQKAVTLRVDLAETDASSRIAAAVEGSFGNADVLVNNAAIQGPIGPLWRNDWAEWEKALRIDLLAPVAICRVLIPLLRRGGKIINLSGGGATGPRPNFTAYATAKAALVRFTETLAQEVGDLGIDVNCVAPGLMGTRLLGSIAAAGAETAGVHEVESASSASAEACERAADLCLFLASAASAGITGKLISAVWDPWKEFPQHRDDLKKTDIFTLRRIVPKDRGLTWGVE